jgi:hypothetical protein
MRITQLPSRIEEQSVFNSKLINSSIVLNKQ